MYTTPTHSHRRTTAAVAVGLLALTATACGTGRSFDAHVGNDDEPAGVDVSMTAGESRSGTDMVVDLDDVFVMHQPAFDLIGRLLHIATAP